MEQSVNRHRRFTIFCLCLNRPLVVRWSEALPKRQRMNLHRNKLSPMELSRSSRRTWIVWNYNVVQLQHSHRRRQENSTYNDWSALPAASLRQVSWWRNFSEWWIIAADSVCMSNIKDHAQSDQHMHAMMLLKKEQGRDAGLGVSSYTLIQCTISLYCCFLASTIWALLLNYSWKVMTDQITQASDQNWVCSDTCPSITK